MREIEYWQDRLEEIHKDCLGASSWDQQFWMTIWLTTARGICPNSNLSSNIGFDQYGTHTQDCSSIASKYAMEPIYPTLLHLTNNDHYYWKGFGVNLLDSVNRNNRPITEEEAYMLSDKLIRANFFKKYSINEEKNSLYN